MNKAIIAAIDKVLILILVLLACVMVGITFAQVFARYVLAHPLFWSEELARYCFVWIVFLGAGAAVKRGAHIGVDYFTKRWPERLVGKVMIFTKTLIVIFLVTVIVNSIPVIRTNMSQKSPAVGLPMGIVYLAIPVGAAVMLAYTADGLWELIRPLFRARRKGGG